jgi:hypothetical protein
MVHIRQKYIISSPKLVEISYELRLSHRLWEKSMVFPHYVNRVNKLNEIGLDNLPAVRLHRDSIGRLSVVDGCHRLHIAITEGRTHIMAEIEEYE